MVVSLSPGGESYLYKFSWLNPFSRRFGSRSDDSYCNNCNHVPPPFFSQRLLGSTGAAPLHGLPAQGPRLAAGLGPASLLCGVQPVEDIIRLGAGKCQLRRLPGKMLTYFWASAPFHFQKKIYFSEVRERFGWPLGAPDLRSIGFRRDNRMCSDPRKPGKPGIYLELLHENLVFKIFIGYECEK